MLDVSDFRRARRHMVETQIARRGIRNEYGWRPCGSAAPEEVLVDEGFAVFACW